MELGAWGPARVLRSLEAANGWTVEPSYARRQLAMLLAGRDGFSSAGPGSMSP